MFYQIQNSLVTDGLKLENGIDFNFPKHLHSSFELVVVTEGEMNISVDDKEYKLYQEDALLIFPNQVHEFITPLHSCHFLCIFSPKLVQAYSNTCLSKIPESNLFRPDYSYIECLASLNNTDSIMSIKGVLYSICGIFDKSASYIEKKGDSNSLLSSIFSFVEDNFSSDCSLESLSKHTSYNYVYLSKYFKRCTGLSFTDYVNRYRINEACYVLQNSEQTILKTAFDCGFDSLRSFNRNFKNVLGITPSVYRENLGGGV